MTRRAGWAAPTAVAALLLSSCGMVGALGDDDAGAQTATVGVLVPASGWQQADGEAVLAAVRAAVEETAGDVGGWTVEVVAVDEGEKGEAAADAVTELVDGDAVAVIGGLTTPGVRAAQPVLDDEDVLFVSPADVVPEHTLGADPTAPLRPYRSYFRTAVGEEPPAAALARYAVSGLGAEAVAVVDGGDPAEARAFSAAVDDAGGTVVASGADAATVVAKAETEGATAVFVAGDHEGAATVDRQLRASGLEATLLGATALSGDPDDGGDDEDRPRDGAVRAQPAQLDATAGVRSGRLAEDIGAALGEFGAAAYDAGTAVGTVLARCLPPASSASSARRGCLGEMSQLDFAGATGEVAFDEFGDRSGGSVRFSVLRDGAWQVVGVDG
ncbi:ABC transporter substrate-binding protein [Jiangella mangrovi]|uniref:ABC-type branched-subunit amino acid transport system substrate-binding protein n=1 Tax=Jiangella mangrovi TaxID=1524084 RepID=A0A7W9GTR9_9ACTN|nr:ABC transporter substrate-binding protein [Jiangella mangrovi]MBB5789654.1 ABC-type branched-subunit amino acid transport system substrate-binding protein [Jiangella mangrovi]